MVYQAIYFPKRTPKPDELVHGSCAYAGRPSPKPPLHPQESALSLSDLPANRLGVLGAPFRGNAHRAVPVEHEPHAALIVAPLKL